MTKNLPNYLKTFDLIAVMEINRIFKGGGPPLYPNGGLVDYQNRVGTFQIEHWMMVGILTPCVIALYLILIMVAYHTFCKVEGRGEHNGNGTTAIEVQIFKR